MEIFIDDHLLVIKSKPSFMARLRFGSKWMAKVTCSIEETRELKLKNRSGFLTLYVKTDTVRYPVFVGANQKKKASKLIYEFGIIKKKLVESNQPIVTKTLLNEEKANDTIYHSIRKPEALEKHIPTIRKANSKVTPAFATKSNVDKILRTKKTKHNISSKSIKYKALQDQSKNRKKTPNLASLKPELEQKKETLKKPTRVVTSSNTNPVEDKIADELRLGTKPMIQPEKKQIEKAILEPLNSTEEPLVIQASNVTKTDSPDETADSISAINEEKNDKPAKNFSDWLDSLNSK